MKSETSPPNSLDNHKPALEERAQLATLMKKCEARIKVLDEALRPVLEGRGEVVYNGFSYKVQQVAGRKSFDKDTAFADMKKAGLNPEDYEKSGAPYTTFTIKEVKSI